MLKDSIETKVSGSIMTKWQDVLNLIATSFGIPNVFITQISKSHTQIILKSETSDGELKVGVEQALAGTFCQKVHDSNRKVLLQDYYIKNANRISYLGHPIKFPNGDWFGVVCALDYNNKKFSSAVHTFLKEFKAIIEADLHESGFQNQEMMKDAKLMEDELSELENLDKEDAIRLLKFDDHLRENDRLLAELIKSEKKYKALFSASNHAIVIFEAITNTDGDLVDLRYKEVNPANEKIIGISREHVLGKTLLELFPNTEARWLAHFNSVVKYGQTESFFSYYSDLKKYIYVDSYPLKDKEFAVSAVDLTDKVNLKKRMSEVENRYEAIFDNSPSVMMLISPEGGGIKDVNESACAFYGYSKAEMLQMNIWDINIAGKEQIKRNIEQVRLNPNEPLKAKHKLASGEIRDVEIHSGSIEVEGKELLHSVIKDVTSKNRDLLKITKLSNAVEQSPASIVITNLDGEIEYANPKTCLVTGYQLNELVGQNPRVLKSGKQSQDVYEDLWNTITAGERWEGEFFNKRKDGSYYWESASVSPILNKQNEAIGYIKIALDISEKKTTEAKLRNALLKAKENDRLKSAFLANLSHEVRTPLNGLLGFTEFIGDDNLSAEERKEFATIIKDCGDQLMAIMNDILQASLLEAKQMEVNLESFCLGQFLKGLIQVHTVEASKKSLKLQLDLQVNESFMLQTDRGKLAQVVNNLVRNAIKFTKVGEIRIACERLKDVILFSVQDTGIGISVNDQRVIFDRFRQVENHLTREHGGTGLGLAISKDIIELLGGEIWVESEHGRGARFSFTLPLYGE
jgi:PAS domain S-box-containing protein